MVTKCSSTRLKTWRDVTIIGSDREAESVARSGKGKVVDRGVKYPKVFIYLPMDVVKDSTFPFKTGEDVTVTIENNRLIIEKLKEKPSMNQLRKKR